MAQLIESFERVRDSKLGMILAVQDLQVLRGVFEVDDSTGAVFDVDPAWFDQFTRLAASQVKRVLPVPGSAAVRESVAASLHAPAQRLVSGHPPQFDERLAFKRRRFSVLAVIILQSLEGGGQRARLAVGPESEVNVEDAFLPGFDELDDLLRQSLEEKTVVNRGSAA